MSQNWPYLLRPTDVENAISAQLRLLRGSTARFDPLIVANSAAHIASILDRAVAEVVATWASRYRLGEAYVARSLGVPEDVASGWINGRFRPFVRFNPPELQQHIGGEYRGAHSIGEVVEGPKGSVLQPGSAALLSAVSKLEVAARDPRSKWLAEEGRTAETLEVVAQSLGACLSEADGITERAVVVARSGQFQWLKSKKEPIPWRRIGHVVGMKAQPAAKRFSFACYRAERFAFLEWLVSDHPAAPAAREKWAQRQRGLPRNDPEALPILAGLMEKDVDVSVLREHVVVNRARREPGYTYPDRYLGPQAANEPEIAEPVLGEGVSAVPAARGLTLVPLPA